MYLCISNGKNQRSFQVSSLLKWAKTTDKQTEYAPVDNQQLQTILNCVQRTKIAFSEARINCGNSARLQNTADVTRVQHDKKAHQWLACGRHTKDIYSWSIDWTTYWTSSRLCSRTTVTELGNCSRKLHLPAHSKWSKNRITNSILFTHSRSSEQPTAYIIYSLTPVQDSISSHSHSQCTTVDKWYNCSFIRSFTRTAVWQYIKFDSHHSSCVFQFSFVLVRRNFCFLTIQSLARDSPAILIWKACRSFVRREECGTSRGQYPLALKQNAAKCLLFQQETISFEKLSATLLASKSIRLHQVGINNAITEDTKNCSQN